MRAGMLQRCYYPAHKDYHRYGGRGITVCARWRESFENFLADMGPRPSPQHSIDRIDNDGPYSPENCRWATGAEQGRHKCSNRVISALGKTMTLIEWGEVTGIAHELIRARIDRLGWTAEAAVTRAPRRWHRCV